MSDDDLEVDPLIEKMIQNRAARLARLMSLASPEVIIDKEWEMLSEAYYRWKVLKMRIAWRKGDEGAIEGES